MSLWDTETFSKEAMTSREIKDIEARIKLGMIDFDYDTALDQLTVYLTHDMLLLNQVVLSFRRENLQKLLIENL